MGSSPARTKAERPNQEPGSRPADPEVRGLVKEASLALARLDANRLEELALTCKAFCGDLASATGDERLALVSEVRAAAKDLAVFARVLDATRANLAVMNRLRELREGRLEYGERQVRGWAPAEASHGDH